MAANWQNMQHVWDIWMAQQAGARSILSLADRRLATLVAYARTRSGFYRQLYRDLPDDCYDLVRLPPVGKRQLMRAFDDWVTDSQVNRASVNEFLADTGQVGHDYLGRYAVYTSSGTTGEPGVYLHDQTAQSVYESLLSVRFDPAGFLSRTVLAGLSQRGFAMIAATGGHFAGTATWERWRRLHPTTRVHVFDVSLPVEELGEQLNRFQPAFVASYPSTVRLLADEQRAGRLKLQLSAVWLGGEGLLPTVRSDIEQAFGCRVIEDYGTSEFMNIAFGCRHGWLHVNTDWVILEPVDENYQPVPPGEPSRSVLLTNLANRIQPFIRYELGDSITVKPSRCRCGSPLPAIQVGGRSDEILQFTATDGRSVSIQPIPLTSRVEDHCRVYRFQLIQTAPDRLAVRLDPPPGRSVEQSRQQVSSQLRHYLASHGLNNVVIEHQDQPPRPDAISGKFRQVWSQTAAR